MIEMAFTNIAWIFDGLGLYFSQCKFWVYYFCNYNTRIIMAELYALLKQESKYFDKSYETQ